jgi:hypothetical protein
VHPVHRSTVDRSKGYESLLIWAADFHRTAVAACGRRAAAGRRRAAGRWRRRRRARRRVHRRRPTGPTGHQSRRGRHKNEEEDKGNAPGSLEGRERHRRRRSRRRSGGRAVSSGRCCCGEGGKKGRGAGWRGGLGAPFIVVSGKGEGREGGGRRLVAAGAINGGGARCAAVSGRGRGRGGGG